MDIQKEDKDERSNKFIGYHVEDI